MNEGVHRKAVLLRWTFCGEEEVECAENGVVEQVQEVKATRDPGQFGRVVTAGVVDVVFEDEDVKVPDGTEVELELDSEDVVAAFDLDVGFAVNVKPDAIWCGWTEGIGELLTDGELEACEELELTARGQEAESGKAAVKEGIENGRLCIEHDGCIEETPLLVLRPLETEQLTGISQ